MQEPELLLRLSRLNMVQSYFPLYAFPKEHCTESTSKAHYDQMTVGALNELYINCPRQREAEFGSKKEPTRNRVLRNSKYEYLCLQRYVGWRVVLKSQAVMLCHQPL
jgi:hypothetical protein